MAQDHKTCAAEMTIGAFSKGNAILVDEHLRVCTLPLHLMPQDAGAKHRMFVRTPVVRRIIRVSVCACFVRAGKRHRGLGSHQQEETEG
eukprot:649850-Amorphochlora_amoeboformis.AAC.1